MELNASTLWWLATGVVVIVELLSGTFYLLMLAIGLAAGAVAAHLGLGGVSRSSFARWWGRDACSPRTGSSGIVRAIRRRVRIAASTWMWASVSRLTHGSLMERPW